jgi:hypothetical protein
VSLVSPSDPPRATPRALAELLVGVAGLALCLTLLFLGMRSVMDVGGSCADGGPYVSAVHCPQGVPLAILGGIFGLFAFGGLAALGGAGIGGRYSGVVGLVWPALFLSLGWNFLEFGVRAPDGPDLSWLICAVVFFVLGGAPVIGWLPSAARASRDPAAMHRLLSDLQARRSQVASDEHVRQSAGPRSMWRADDGAARTDLTSRLERLADLHRTGSLTDAEFDDAKRQVIAEVASGR